MYDTALHLEKMTINKQRERNHCYRVHQPETKKVMLEAEKKETTRRHKLGLLAVPRPGYAQVVATVETTEC